MKNKMKRKKGSRKFSIFQSTVFTFIAFISITVQLLVPIPPQHYLEKPFYILVRQRYGKMR